MGPIRRWILEWMTGLTNTVAQTQGATPEEMLMADRLLELAWERRGQQGSSPFLHSQMSYLTGYIQMRHMSQQITNIESLITQPISRTTERITNENISQARNFLSTPPNMPALAPITPALNNSNSNIEAPEELTCPISMEIMTDPVYFNGLRTTQCFERSYIMQHLQTSQIHPTTRENVTGLELVSNTALKQQCADFVRASANTPITPALNNSNSNIEAPEELTCPISMEIMTDPVYFNGLRTTQCFERSYIMQHLQTSQIHPITRENVTGLELVSNTVLKQQCADFVRASASTAGADFRALAFPRR